MTRVASAKTSFVRSATTSSVLPLLSRALYCCCFLSFFIYLTDAAAQDVADLGNLDAFSESSPRTISGSVDQSNLNDWFRYSIGRTTNLTMRINESAGGFADICIYADGVTVASVQAVEGDCIDSDVRVSQFEGQLIPEETIKTWPTQVGTYYFRVNAFTGASINYDISIWTEGEPGVTLSHTSMNLSENESQTYTVKLESAPPSVTTIAIASQHPSVTVSPESLTFTSENWSSAQTVRVTAEQDDDADNRTVEVTHSVSGYGSISDGGVVTVNVIDGDMRDIVVSESALTQTEGQVGSYSVHLSSRPDQEVTVTPRSDNSHVRFEPDSLTFGAEDWSTPQELSFSIEEENESASVTIRHEVSGYGDLTEGGVVTVSVVQSLAEPDSERKQAAERTVAAVAAAAVSNVTSNIGARFSAPNTGGASISLAGMPVVFGQSSSRESAWTSLADPFDEFGDDGWQTRTRSLTADELLGSTSFEIALGASQGSNGNPTDLGPQVTVWGRGDFQVFESGGGQNSGYDGDLVAGYLGADFNTGGSWLLGMALSRIKAEADYTLDNAGGAGTLEAELTNLHPYVRFALDDRSEAWTILGLGKGEVTDSAQGGSTSKSDLSMQMMSAGARHLLNSFIGIDWALLGDGSLAKVNTSEGVEAVDGISASVWRVRAGVEASYTSVWEGGSALTTFLEIAGRQDGGASAEGRGLELSPGLAFSDPESGFSIEARGRALVLHSADNHREYGASLTASLAPGTDGTGLSFAMTPTWGTPANSLDSVDASLFPREVVGGRADSLSLNSRVAYGFAAGPGVLSPFAEFSLHDSDSHRTRVGSRYSLSPSVDLELSGDRTSDGIGSAEHSVQFRTRIGF